MGESRNERAKRIVNRWLARYRTHDADGDIVLVLRGTRLAISLADLEREIAGEIDLAERAAWVSAVDSLKTSD